MSRIEQIKIAIEKKFRPEKCEIIDQSHLHSRHFKGDAQGCSHIKIRLWKPVFQSEKKVSQHQEIYALFTRELQDFLHSLSIEIVEQND